MRICTIISRSYLAQARVLARSYAEHNRGEPCSALLLDDPDRTVDDSSQPFVIVRPEQLEIDRFEAMAAVYDATELAAAMRPWLLRHLLARHPGPLAYVDPDVRFFGEIDEIAQLAAEGKVVLTPHLLGEPLPRDEFEPSESTLLAAGNYDLGFIALAPGPTADRLISWWSEPARDASSMQDGPDGHHDQRRFDLIASVTSALHPSGDPGANVSYWNLHERALERHEGRYAVNGKPLRFFHFSGFDRARPFTLSRHQTRVRLADHPLLAEICNAYAADLKAEGVEGALAQRWRYGSLHDGTKLTPLLRRLYAEGERAGAFRTSPFTEAGAEEFRAWCQEPAELGANHGLTRLCLAMYRMRPDLRQAFRDLNGDDGPDFLTWVHRHGVQEIEVDPRWLPPEPDGARKDARRDEQEVWGVNVAGYLRSELGVGEVARGVITALDARDVPVMPIHGKLIPRSRQGHPFAFFDTSSAPFPVNLICVNADHFSAFLADAGPEFFENRYNIGFWWWEVTSVPDSSLAAFELVDEIWVGTEYVGEALRVVSPVPVVKVTVPVAPPPAVSYSRVDLGLPGGFLFLFMFDFNSGFERKDPLGLIDAFSTAFDPGSGASLVIKCINQGGDPDNHDRLRLAAQTHPDVHIMDQYVSAERKDAMLGACDCYVSLHRAEGFGLPLAEAMYLGKPVIATRYSGNLDFMSDSNSYLVDYELKPVGEGNYPYPPDAEWASADRDHAARLMREVFENPLEAARRAHQGAADIRRTHSVDAAGQTMQDRLKTVRSHLDRHLPVRHMSSSPALPGELAQLQDLIDHPVELRRRSPRGPVRDLARRVALRVMKPVIEHQSQLSERGQQIQRGLVRELARQDAARSSELRQVGRRAGAQVGALMSQLRSSEAALRSMRAEIAALRAEVRPERATSDPEGSPAALSGDAVDVVPAPDSGPTVHSTVHGRD